MVVAPRVLVDVGLQPLDGHAVVVARDAVLDVPEEPLDGSRVDVSTCVHAVGVFDRVVRRVGGVQAAVSGPLVGVDGRGRVDVLG